MVSVLKKNRLIWVFLLAPYTLYGLVDAVITTTRVVVASEASDQDGNQIIQVAVGAPEGDPATWPIITLSASVSNAYNFGPKAFANQAGDVVVLWKYLDQDFGFTQIAAASLLSTSTLWNVTRISELQDDAAQEDYVAVLNDGGDVVAAWTSYNPELNIYSAVVATTNLYTSTMWSDPVAIIQEW